MRLTQVNDTYTAQAKSTTNYVTSQTLQVSNTASKIEYAFLQFGGIPTGATVTITNGTLRVYAKGVWASTSLVAEQVTGTWTASSLKYSANPAVTATGAVTVTQSAVDGTEFAFNITPFVQNWAGGAPNYGVRIRSTSTTMHELYSAEGTGTLAIHPVLDVTYTQPPGVPTALNPANNQQVSIANPTLTWTPDRSLADQFAYQLQTNATNVWTSPTFDSGQVVSNLAQHTLAATVTNGSTLWWRVRTQNAALQWSDWTAGAQFGRTNKSALTITTPPAPSGNVVTELTPPFAWTFGGTQVGYRIYNTTDTDLNTIVWDSLYTPGAGTGYTSSVPFAVNGAGDSRVTLQVYDNVNRASTPGDQPYTETTRTFHYTPSVGTAPFTTLVATQSSPQPGVSLTFARSSVPDFMQIVRTDTVAGTTKTWADLNPLDYDTSSTTYLWSDMTAAPGHPYQYRVDAVVNGIASSASPTVTTTLTVGYVWLLDPTDPTWFIPIAGTDSGTWPMGEQSDIHEIRGADFVVLISQALRGYEGTFTGGLFTGLAGLGSLTAQQIRNRVWAIKRAPTKTYRLVVSDMNIPVVLRNVAIAPTPFAEYAFSMSFEFYQQGELPWS